jgi:hypothetical protein
MRVIKMAKRCKCAKLRASTVSSTIITESLPTIKPQYFGPQPIKRNDRVRQAISRVVQNKGGYVEKQHPEGRSKSIPPEKMDEETIVKFRKLFLRTGNSANMISSYLSV